MSKNIQYVEVLPTNYKTSYSAQELLNFDLVGDVNTCLVMGTVCLVFNVSITNYTLQNDITEPDYEFVKYDPMVGGNSFIDNISVQTLAQGSIEYISNYPHYCAVLNASSVSQNDCVADTVFTTQGMCPNNKMTGNLLAGFSTDPDNYQVNNRPLRVSVPLKICLNNSMNASVLDFKRVGGKITLSMYVSRDVRCLWGNEGIGSNLTLQLSDVKLSYTTKPITPKTKIPAQLTMKTAYSMVQTLQSRVSDLQIEVPLSMATGFFMVFRRTDEEYSSEYNSLQLDRLNDLNRVIYSVNNNLNNLSISYELRHQEEVIKYFIDALSLANNNLNLNTTFSNRMYGCGLNFNTVLNLVGQKINVQLDYQSVDNDNKYNAYTFITGLITL